MKKLVLMSIIGLAILALSCKKEKKDELPIENHQEVTNENVSDNWKIRAFEIDAEGEFLGNNFKVVARGQDIDMDFLFENTPNICKLNGEMNLNIQVFIAGTKADERDEPMEYEDEEGTWELIDNNTKMKIDILLLDINEVNVENLVLKVAKLTDKEMILEGTNKVFVNALNEEVDGFLKLRLTR